MKAIKKFLVKAIFNERQRNTIMHAIEYSEYKYKQHGNVDQAVHVAVVKEEVKDIFSVKPAAPKTYSETEVKNIVAGAILHTLELVLKHRSNGIKQNGVNCVHVELKPGMVLDRAKCEACEHKDDCEIKHIVFDEETAYENETAEADTTVNGTDDDASSHDDAVQANDQPRGEVETEVRNESAE